LLAKGATITMGCVNEPYLSGTPEVAVFIARLIYNRFTFGEAAYASQPVLSWQTTVVGDPLYRPFGQDPDRQHQELQTRGSKLIEWSWLRLVNLNQVTGKSLAEVAALLEQIVAKQPSAVLSEKLADVYAKQGKPSSAVQIYAQALGLDPSPQQRVRLLLTLAEKLVALDRPQEAYEHYQRLLREFPNYPDKLGLYQKMLPLAQKLDNKADVEKYQAEITRLTPPPSKPQPESAPSQSSAPKHPEAPPPVSTPKP
jgi:tetratricopeptide (TPR) repeat protein